MAKEVARLITDWAKPHLPEASHAILEQAFEALFDERYGFARSGNSTAHKLDKLARQSSCVEPTEDGPVYIISTMEGHRPEDAARAYLFYHVSTFIHPPEQRADGKWSRFEAKREQWCNSLGFYKTEIGRGKRLFLDLKKAGTQELLDAIQALVPTEFKGTDAPASTKVQVKIILPSTLGSEPVYSSLYDPEDPTVNEVKFKKDLAKVTVFLDGGCLLGLDKKDALPRVAALYQEAYMQSKSAPAEKPEAAPEANENVLDVAVSPAA